MAAKPIPDGYHTLTPYLVVDDGAAALAWYAKAFGAKEILRLEHDGRLGHGEMQIGNSHFMLSNEWPEWGYRSAKAIGGTPVSLMIYVDDCDKVFDRAVAAGATVRAPVMDQFYGDRSGNITDPFGHQWTIGTHKEDMSGEELQRRFTEMMAGAGAPAD